MANRPWNCSKLWSRDERPRNIGGKKLPKAVLQTTAFFLESGVCQELQFVRWSLAASRIPQVGSCGPFDHPSYLDKFDMRPTNKSRKRRKTTVRAKKKDPIFVDGKRPRPMYVDYKDIDLLRKLINRHGRIVGRRGRPLPGCRFGGRLVSRRVARNDDGHPDPYG